MGEVLKFQRRKPAARGEGLTLCRHGFHKWRVVQDRRFDVKQGKLVTSYRCERCGATRNEVT
jgi:hypothetical protein